MVPQPHQSPGPWNVGGNSLQQNALLILGNLDHGKARAMGGEPWSAPPSGSGPQPCQAFYLLAVRSGQQACTSLDDARYHANRSVPQAARSALQGSEAWSTSSNFAPQHALRKIGCQS